MTSTLLTEKVDNLSPNKNQGELWVVNNPKRAFWVVNNPQKLPRDIMFFIWNGFELSFNLTISVANF